jgi:uncharacterized damage-inducible protein DinB
MKRYSMMITCALAGALGLQAQIASTHIAEGKQLYTGIKNNLVAMADKMSEEDYAFKPTADIRSFGQLVAHVADVQAAACSVASGVQKRVGAASKTTKADLATALKASFDICDAAWDGLTDATANDQVSFGPIKGSKLGVLEFNTMHSDEEYGYMSVYLRLKGVVPPSTAGRGH